MKAQIHPTWYPEAKVACTCGNTFTTGSTQEQIHIEVCSACHPFFTGQMRYVGIAGRVDKFRERQKNIAKSEGLSKKERRALKRKEKMEEELSRPSSLEEVRKDFEK